MILELEIQPKNLYRPPRFNEFAPFLRSLREMRVYRTDGRLYLQRRPTRIVSVFPAVPVEPEIGEMQSAVVGLEVDGQAPNQLGFSGEGDAMESLRDGEKSYLTYIKLFADLCHLNVEWILGMQHTDEYLERCGRLGLHTPPAYEEFLDP